MDGRWKLQAATAMGGENRLNAWFALEPMVWAMGIQNGVIHGSCD